MASKWTDEMKQQAIDLYTAENPTEENTMDIVAKVAEKVGETVNGTRMILNKAGVYIAKGKAKATTPGATGDKPKRKSKQESLDDLTKILTDHEVEVDDTVVSKLTGKAAEYFITAFKQIIEA